MKMSKLKIIGLALIVLSLLTAGIVYYASTKLNPEEIRKIAISQTEKVFPNASVSLENVEIGWGLNFKIELQKFALKTKKTDGSVAEMMAVDDLIVKVPLWAIMTNAGVIEIQLEKPLVNYEEFPTGNNWTYAMGEKKVQDAPKETEGASSPDSAIGLFGKSKINVKVSDVSIKYLLRDNSSGQLSISRFLIKGLNFESSTAFEIASDAKFVMGDKSVVSFSTLAIGEINIADLVKNGAVSSLVFIKVNNIAKTGLEWKFPEITTNLNLLLKKDGEVSGKVETSFESQNKISATFKMTKQIEISDINVDVILKDVGAIIGLDRSIDLSKAKLNAKGGLIYSEDKKVDANLSFSISPGIGFSQDGINASTSIEGSFKQKDLAIKVKTEVLSGVIDTFINGEYDPNQKFDLKTLKPFDIKVTATRLKVPEKLIQEKLWAKKDPAVVAQEIEKAQQAQVKAEAEGKNPPGLPPANIQLVWSNVSIGGEDFSGRGKVVVSSNAVAIDNLAFKFSRGSGALTQTMKLGVKSNESVF